MRRQLCALATTEDTLLTTEQTFQLKLQGIFLS